MKHDYEESPEFTKDIEFNDLLRKIRRVNGYSQTDFGEMLGVNQKTISSWETGKFSPPVESAKYILKRFGIRMVFEKET